MMDTANTDFLYSASAKELQISVEPRLQAISERFSARGLVKAVRAEAESQEKRECETALLQPLAYRLSGLNEGYVSARYRHGKDVMSAGDLVEYFCDTRAIRTKDADFSAVLPEDEKVLASEEEKACVSAVRSVTEPGLCERISKLPAQIKAFPKKALNKARSTHNAWFDCSKANTRSNTHRFPLSALAAIFAVAISLMLIVASSVMINQGENRLNALKLEMSALTGEVSELRSDLCMENDLLAIREVAMNEYGMVSEEFICMEYLSAQKGDVIEVFEEAPEQTIGLSAILSALGFK